MECPTCGRVFETSRGARQHHTKVHGEPLANRTCNGCGERFYDPKARLEYCDDCNPNAGQNNGNYSGARERTECERCGTAFGYYPSNKDGVYCSECVERADEFLGTPYAEMVDAERVSRVCKQCGQSRSVLKSEIERGEGQFCGRECHSEWLSENRVGEEHHHWKPGETEYSGEWWSVRETALERDDHECQRCGRAADEIGREPDVHHVTPVREFENAQDAHSIENVVTLCRSCHSKVENGDTACPDPRRGG